MTVEELLTLKPGDRVFVIPAFMPVSGTLRFRYDDTEVDYSIMAGFFGRECTVDTVVNDDRIAHRDSSYVMLKEDPDKWSWFSEMIELPYDPAEIECSSEDLFDMEVSAS